MQYDYTTNIINLQDKNLIIDRTDVIDNTIYIYVHKDISNSDHCCRHWGCTDIKILGYYTRKIKYLTFGGKQSYIIYKLVNKKGEIVHLYKGTNVEVRENIFTKEITVKYDKAIYKTILIEKRNRNRVQTLINDQKELINYLCMLKMIKKVIMKI